MDETNTNGSQLDRLERWGRSHTNVVAMIAAIGSVLSGLGLFFTVASLRDARASADAQSYAAVSGIWREHMAMFVEHPDLRPYFFDKKVPTAKDPNIQALQAMSDARLDAMDRVLWSADMANWTDSETADWRGLFSRAFKDGPILCEGWSTGRRDYPKLRAIGNDACGVSD